MSVRALDFRKAVEGVGGDMRAIVVQRRVPVGRTACFRRAACVWRGPLRIGRIVRSRNDGRMLEQTRRIAVFRCKRGACRQRDGKCEK